LNAFLKYCLLLTATFILLLHSFVPHQHHVIAASQPTISACVHTENSFLGFLSEVFHLDLGSDHLENFKPVHKADLALSVSIAAYIQDTEPLLTESIDDGNYYLPVFILQSHQFSTRQTPLRGPPRRFS